MRIRFQPSGENVSGLKIRGESSGFVNACENASIATIRPMSGGSTALRRTSSANRPGIELDGVDVAVDVPQALLDARVARDVLEPPRPRESGEPAVLVVWPQLDRTRLLDARHLGLPHLAAES